MKRYGFTLIELLVVVAIIVALIAILLPSMGRALETAQIAVCLSNQRQLQVAWLAYPVDHMGKLIGAENEDDDPSRGIGDSWVRSNGVVPETIDHLENGELWPYIDRQLDLYLCPNEQRAGYLRSYSISTYLNGGTWSGWNGYMTIARTMSMIEGPGERLCFIDDSDPRGANFGSWAHFPMDWPGPHIWSDWPGNRHLNGNTHSFADGHAAYHEFDDPLTATISAFGTPAPNSPDFAYYQRLFSP